MARGGSREGAGRKAGTPNKSTAELKAAVAASGETPAEYMLRVMRDPTVDHDRRDKMAVAAAPYVHAKLAAVELTGKDGGPIQTEDVSETEAARRIAFTLARARQDKPAVH